MTTIHYRRRSSLDERLVHRVVSQFLAAESAEVEATFEAGGYSGDVYHLVVHSRSEPDRELILKGIPDEIPYRLYQDVLAPYELDSPEMLGTVATEHGFYLVMQYVPHEPADWGDYEKYRRAIDWLGFKDRTVSPQLTQLARLDYLDAYTMGEPEARLALLQAACEEGWDPLLNRRLGQALQRAADRFDELSAGLRRGPQTITHNDFQMLNILFGTGPAAGQIFVVDWTSPAIGSVCIDLATLVHVAPEELRSELIERYRAIQPIEPFAPIFEAAQAHVYLSILSWMADAIRTGQGHTIWRPKMEEIVESLIRYLKG